MFGPLCLTHQEGDKYRVDNLTTGAVHWTYGPEAEVMARVEREGYAWAARGGQIPKGSMRRRQKVEAEALASGTLSPP